MMPSRLPFRPILTLALLMSLLLPIGAASAATVAEQCVADLDDAAKFMAANDAGASALLAEHGPAIARAYDTARAAAFHATGEESCWNILSTYLRAWRAGHLAVGRTSQDRVFSALAPRDDSARVDPRAPRVQALDKDTLLLTLPTFGDAYRPVMQRVLAEQRAVLQSHRNWIIDVRRNDGGSDSTYGPLLPWLLDGELRTQSVEYFATPANAQAQEDVCAMTSDPAACKTTLAPIAAKLRAAPPGSFVLQGAGRVMVDPITPEPERPARVAVLIDQPCGSSCEQFVLAARTSFRVKVVGRPTGGVLDYSNLRPHKLPSGRPLFYATTRSTRLPDMRIDGVGIAPDILLSRPVDDAGREAEVKRVQRWLEGASLEDAPSGK